MSKYQFSRRQFLRIAAVAGASSVAAACAPAAPSAPPAGVSAPAAAEAEPAVAPPAAEAKIKISLSTYGAPFEDKLYTDFYIPGFAEEHPDVEVEFLHLQDYIADVVRLSAAGTAPDVIRHVGTQLEWAIAGILAPLDDLMDAAKLDKEDFVEATWIGSTLKGKIYAMSQSPNFMGLWYSKKAFDEAGLKYPDNNYTMDQLLADAKALTKKDANGNVIQYGYVQDWAAAPFIIGSWVYAFGGRLLSEDGTRAVFDSPETIEAFVMMQRMVQEGVAATSSAQGNVGSIQFFGQGKAAMIGQGTHMASIGTQQAPDLKFAGVTWPKAKVRSCVATDVGFGISDGSKNKPQAFDFMAYMLNKPNLLEYWQQLWVALPARKSVFNDPAIRQIKGIPDFSPSLTYGDEEFKDKCQWEIDAYNDKIVHLDWSSPWLAKMNPILGEVISGISLESDATNPEQAVKDAQVKFDKIIQDNPI